MSATISYGTEPNGAPDNGNDGCAATFPQQSQGTRPQGTMPLTLLVQTTAPELHEPTGAHQLVHQRCARQLAERANTP